MKKNASKAAAAMVLVFLLSMQGMAFARESEGFALQIVDITTPAIAGERLRFSFAIANLTPESSEFAVDYWLEENSETVVSGSDTIFLDAKREKTERASLQLYSDMQGKYEFFIRLAHSDKNFTAKRTIEVKKGVPSVLSLYLSEMSGIRENQAFEFTVNLSSNKYEEIPIELRETIFLEEEIILQNRKDLTVARENTLSEKVEGLKAGSYKLEVIAHYNEGTARAVRAFEVKAEASEQAKQNINSLILAGLLLVIMALIVVVLLFTRGPKIGELNASF